MPKTLKASLLIRPSSRSPYRRETRTVLIRLSGRWLENLGFYPGQPFYVTEADGNLVLSPYPPQPAQLAPLDQLKADFARLGIPTSR